MIKRDIDRNAEVKIERCGQKWRSKDIDRIGTKKMES